MSSISKPLSQSATTTMEHETVVEDFRVMEELRIQDETERLRREDVAAQQQAAIAVAAATSTSRINNSCPSSTGEQQQQRERLITFVMCSVAILGITLVVILTSGDNTVTIITSTSSPTNPPTITESNENILINILSSISNESQIRDTSTPHNHALHWLLDYLYNNDTDDDLSTSNKVVENQNHPQRVKELYALLIFFNVTNGVNWTETRGWLQQTQELPCDWFGVTCNNHDLGTLKNLDLSTFVRYLPAADFCKGVHFCLIV